MLKKFNGTDIDDMMSFWKYEVKKIKNSYLNENFMSSYTYTKNMFLENIPATTVYTEDDSICGYVSVDKNNEIWRNTCKRGVKERRNRYCSN